MSRPATSPELAYFRTAEQRVILRAAIYVPTTIYQARINQTFSSFDGVLEITYDTGSGTLSDVLPDMTLLIGSSAGAWDIGICRIRSIDATKVYIAQEASISFADNQYLTIVDDFILYAKHVLIDSGIPYMDGGVAYSDQHTNPDPVPIMGGNRVLKLTGATVSASFDWSASYMPDGSSIVTYACSAPGSSSSSGMSTTTPTVTWNSVGWKKVYLTLVGANGKSFFGVRYVFVWNASNEPASVEIGENSQDVDSGGSEFSITLFDHASLSQVRDHALVILFAEDYYGTTNSQIGPLTGCENVVISGWIAKETINMNPEQGAVEFTIYTAQYWMQRIPAYPDGVEFVTGTPAAWTEMKNLTVKLGLWHFLHWRTTATRIMDVFLPDDTKYTKEVSSLAGNLWDQIREMAFDQIFARAGVNEYNQLYIQVHPNLMPSASRSSIPVVMDIETRDWVGEINFERVTIPEVAVVAGSGVYVNSVGSGSPFFSLAPGHTYPHYGTIESIENLLVSSQSQCNTLISLYREWRNNPLPEIPIALAANNRLVGCFPNQYCTISISSADNVRGFAYTGKLIPTAKQYVFDAETGYLHTEVSFEAETFEGLVVNGDVPGQGDRSEVPNLPLPKFPDFPTFVPGPFPNSEFLGGPPKVLLHCQTYGLLYTENFDQSAPKPNWIAVNGGLNRTLYSNPTVPNYKLINYIGICPNGAVYVAYIPASNPWDAFIARAPSVGAEFTYLYDAADPALNGSDIQFQIWSCAVNPLVPEQFAFIMGTQSLRHIFVGAAGSYAQGAAVHSDYAVGFGCAAMHYGINQWLIASSTKYQTIAASGAAVVDTRTHTAAVANFMRVLATGTSFHQDNDDFRRGSQNLVFDELLGNFTNLQFFAPFPSTPNTCDCDPTGYLIMGRVFVGAKGKSSDGGFSFLTLPNLPPGVWNFQWAGKSGDAASASRWIAAGGTAIRYSPDFGTTWENREGDITSIAPITNIDLVRVVSY